MKHHLQFLIFVCLFLSPQLYGQEEPISGGELLNRSIAFHDPNSQWKRIKLNLILDQEMPDGSVRPSRVVIDNYKGEFELSFVKENHLYTWRVDGMDSTESYLDYRVITDTLRVDTLGLGPARSRRWRDYYTYLYGLPMKLKDKGTNVDPVVQTTTFNGKPVLGLKVTYEKRVGLDIWYFYFNPNTYALEGYRFFHDESINDGEYILVEGLEIQNGMRIPKHRTWYTNQENKWLGTDRLIEAKVKRN